MPRPRVQAVSRDETHRFSKVPAASITLVAVSVIRKAGVMAVVERGGEVVPGNRIVVTLPPEPHVPLAPV